jgi:hypothetical protein
VVVLIASVPCFTYRVLDHELVLSVPAKVYVHLGPGPAALDRPPRRGLVLLAVEDAARAEEDLEGAA